MFFNESCTDAQVAAYVHQIDPYKLGPIALRWLSLDVANRGLPVNELPDWLKPRVVHEHEVSKRPPFNAVDLWRRNWQPTVSEEDRLFAVSFCGSVWRGECDLTLDDMCIWSCKDEETDQQIPYLVVARQGIYIEDDLEESMSYTLMGFGRFHDIPVVTTRDIVKRVFGDKEAA